MRPTRYIIIAVLTLLSLVSCRYKDPELLDCEYFDSLIFERKLNFETMLSDVMDQYGIHADSYAEMADLLEKGRRVGENYTLYGIRYKTVDHEGKPVLASGLVYYPETTHINGIIEIVPVNKNRISCGTVNQSIPEAIAGCTGYIMIASDLLGCGESSQYPICYLQHDCIVQSAVDMRKAAYEFLYNHRYMRLGGKDYLFGYSLGGGGVLALARHYVLHPELGIKVKELWLGGGAYYPLQAVETMLDQGREAAFILPNILWSMDKYDSLGVDFDRLFVGEFKDRYPEEITGDVPTETLTKIYGPVLSDYMDMSYFDESNETWQKARAALLRKDVPIDFKPDFPIYLYHSEDDETLPVSQSDTLYSRLKAAGAKVKYNRLKGSHHLIGFTIEGDMARHLLK